MSVVVLIIIDRPNLENKDDRVMLRPTVDSKVCEKVFNTTRAVFGHGSYKLLL